MDDAVRRARDAASPGDVVLLSPACASFDMFDDFEDRGRKFRAAVEAMAAGDGPGDDPSGATPRGTDREDPATGARRNDSGGDR
jgi:UDP-N-acetylmuramoylalanine--D-glutamate ligase